MQWNKENVVKFIEIYRNKELLWDPKHKHYYNKILKNDAWVEISQEMECSVSVEDLKKKMDSLLGQLRREKAKMRMFTGQGTDEVYRSSWYAYEHLTFLFKRNKPRSRMNSVFKSTPTKRKKASDSDIRIISSACDMLSSATAAAREVSAEASTSDDIQIYASFIASKFRLYSQRTKNALQHQISNLLFQADNGHFEDAQQPNYTSLQSASSFIINESKYQPNQVQSPATSPTSESDTQDSFDDKHNSHF